MAAYATRWHTYYDELGYVFVVRAADGHYVWGAYRIDHGVANAGLYVTSNGMYFDSYGIVYMTFAHERPNNLGYTNVDVDGSLPNLYHTKLAVASFDGSTGDLLFYHHQVKFFGESFAMAYADFGASASNVYFGGYIDTCYYMSSGPDPCWSLSLNRLKPTGLSESQRQIWLEDTAFTDKTRVPQIDNMQYQSGGTVTGEWLFGTTRGQRRDELGEMIYVWRCDLDSNHDPRDTNLEARQLSTADVYSMSIVTGVYPKMVGSKMSFMLYYKTSEADEYGELRFVEFDFNSGTATGVLIAKEIHQQYPYTVFMGSSTKSSNGITIYESYTAGSSYYFETDTGTTTMAKAHGVVIPTILTDSCLKDMTSEPVLTIGTIAKTPTMTSIEEEFGPSVQSGHGSMGEVSL